MSGIEEPIARWMAAERGLYPLALSDPEAYERSLLLVRAIADALRESDTPAGLEQAWGDRASVVERAKAGSQAPWGAVDLELVTSAGFGLRYREMLAETARREVDERIERAKERGSPWAVVRETVSALGPSMPPYHRWEVHVSTGVLVHASVELGPEMDRPTFQIEVIPPESTPEAPRADPAGAERHGFVDRAAWERGLAEVKARLERSA